MTPTPPAPRRTARLRLTAVAAAAALTGGLLALAAPPAAAAPSGPAADFNGDGYRDVAVAAPLAKIDGKSGAGYVAVVYGTAGGLKTSGRQIISQATTGIPGVPESGDYFGDRLTTGDLDGDGYTDLVVGVHAERVGSTDEHGALTVIWGGASGLKTATDLASPLPEHRNELGWSVAAGDFDGDGDTDLAAANLALPELNVFEGPFTRTGRATGLVGIDTYEQTGINTDRLVAGDVTGDGASDLLVMGGEEITDGYRTRSVLYRGSATGLEPGSKLAGGYAAVIADVDKDGYGDVVTGNFMEKSTDEPNGGHGGAVTVTYGASGGLSTRTPVRITQDTTNVPGTAETGDRFGWSLSAGDTDGDGYADIAVGAESETVGSARWAGSVTVLRGSASGLTGTGAKSFTQNTSGVPGTAETEDHFGSAVHLTDADGNGRAELVASAPAENAGAGSVWLLKSATSGITATGATSFGAGTLGAPSGLAALGDVLAG
ncbi:FG-GAP and VCBS repeat-containing protein [Streptomyces sp. Tu 3180]|uniref:FG-GAP and VCBS repeat-containing protein n=1 Tax=Streptomyces sp. Tu 3180 TaxID=2682611 RepID=UPI001357B906|nr:FG-GAP and VCBS repeat-containing protein [Streptomyces sp. Tu 3180]KAF3466540.1 VCBS repeat-containing protein [Streptomyces sp. Tu 3180]